jgi:hypothetical protein
MRRAYVDAEWWDELDVSGGRIDGEGLQATLGRAVAGKVDGILVAKIDWSPGSSRQRVA